MFKIYSKIKKKNYFTFFILLKKILKLLTYLHQMNFYKHLYLNLRKRKLLIRINTLNTTLLKQEDKFKSPGY